MAVVAIIPARYGSTRFPGKPLARIGGKPMVQHVYESASKARGLDRILVATDDRRILEAVRDFGGEAVLTSKNHRSGTDRLAEVAKKLKAEWVINVQGDLPFVQPQTISRTIGPLRRDRSLFMGTARTPIYEKEEWFNPNVVKVVTDGRGFALYFSRAPIPYIREPTGNGDGFSPKAEPYEKKIWGYRHVGVYAYRRDFLLKFSRLRQTLLERTEGLEQLRALAHGYRIRVTEVEEPSVEIDTPEDLNKVERHLTAPEHSPDGGTRD
ncbi:MAG: 3-deoxy-manno-octulosonate cytidylyltransferase [Deltaproteobacteria bacterium]|nr:3-deoxy-manno-octulosonate cytidylyltransferase [Deltaproteobacteria bacterium]